MQYLSAAIQGLQGWIQNDPWIEPEDQDIFPAFITITAAVTGVVAFIFCYYTRKTVYPGDWSPAHLQEVKAQLRQQHELTPFQTLDGLEFSKDREDNFFSCSEERVRLLHQMSIEVLSPSKIKRYHKEIQEIAHEIIESFIENGQNQRSKNLRSCMRKYVFTVFQRLFSGSDYLGYREDVLSDTENLLKYKSKPFRSETFIGYMYNKPESFTPSQIRRTLMSLLVAMNASTANVIIATLNVWAKLPKHVQKLRSIDDPMLFQHEMTKQILESMRYEPPPGTLGQRGGINLSGFIGNPAIVGPEPWDFNPDRYDNRQIFGKKIELLRKAPWLPFSLGNHACIGDQFAQTIITNLFEVLLRSFEYRIVGKNLMNRNLKEMSGFEIRRKRNDGPNDGGWL